MKESVGALAEVATWKVREQDVSMVKKKITWTIMITKNNDQEGIRIVKGEQNEET